MRIPKGILVAAELGVGETINHVVIECEEKDRQEVKKIFEQEFTRIAIEEISGWLDLSECVGLYSDPRYNIVTLNEFDLVDYVIEKYGCFWGFDPERLDSYDVEMREIKEGWLVTYPVLAYMRDNGDSLEDCAEVIKYTLMRIKNKYPNCSYFGYEEYYLHDAHMERIEQQFISSDEECTQIPEEIDAKINYFIGMRISSIMEYEDFWYQLEMYKLDDEKEEVLGFLEKYKKYISEENTKRIMSLFLDEDR